MVENKDKIAQRFNDLVEIMARLRGPGGCPWDQEQTHESLKKYLIEETYELSDAILEGNLEEVKKELGDLMLHNVFYARIASEKGTFDIENVLNEVCDKLVRRHPHIYGNVKAENDEKVKENWGKIKLKEKGNKSVLGGVPQSLPALIKALRIQEKARGVGFDWQKKEQVWEKVVEEMNEFKQEAEALELQPERKLQLQEEFGDLLFSLINYARFLDINPEEALERTNKKFIQRFEYLESEAKKDGKTLSNMSLEEMDYYWNKAKEHTFNQAK